MGPSLSPLLCDLGQTCIASVPLKIVYEVFRFFSCFGVFQGGRGSPPPPALLFPVTFRVYSFLSKDAESRERGQGACAEALLLHWLGCVSTLLGAQFLPAPLLEHCS